ncbi:MAG: lamin tail domain-containing protein [Candidatus Peribacteraceae bacterium]|nr:lamin tail domain-containing protein [Candidatus Peribacteraceae bacterium]
MTPCRRLRTTLFAVALLWSASFIPSAYAQVVISEVMWMGSDLSTYDEWVEITSTNEARISIEGWTLTTLASNGSETPIIEFPLGEALEPGQYFVISKYGADRSRMSHESDFVAATMSLPNTKLLLRLRDASGAIIDEVDDGAGDPFAGANPAGGGSKASMERIDLLLFGTSKDNWRTAVLSCGFKEGSPIFGSPGFAQCGGGAMASSSFSSSETFSVSSSSDPSMSSASSGTSAEEDSSISPSSGSSSSFETQSTKEDDSSVSVLLSEILADPEGADTDEWIEIGNFGQEAVDLFGWNIARGGGAYRYPNHAIVGPGERISLRKSLSGLSLPNEGGTILLFSGSIVTDRVEYPKTAEGVSYGRSPEDFSLWTALCIPTEGRGNTLEKPDVDIVVQSGKTSGVGSVSVNVQAAVSLGSPPPLRCCFEYGDGFVSEHCNPSYHTFSQSGDYEIILTGETYCGSFVPARLRVTVESEEEAASFDKETEDYEPEEAASSAQSSAVCAPSASGVILSEVYPYPGEDKEEWIELHNVSDEKILLCGWTLDDVRFGGSHPFSITDEFVITSGGYLVLSGEETGLKLNNDGDEVHLLSLAGVDRSVTVPRLKEGESYAYVDWRWCVSEEATPGEPNRCRSSSSSSVRSSVKAKKATVSRASAAKSTKKTSTAKKSVVTSMFDDRLVAYAGSGTLLITKASEDRTLELLVASIGIILFGGFFVVRRYL